MESDFRLRLDFYFEILGARSLHGLVIGHLRFMLRLSIGRDE